MSRKRRLPVVALAASVAGWTTAHAHTQDVAAPPSASRLSAAIRFSGPTADTLRIILKGAHARMTAAKCQSVFSRFQDAGRRPLAQKLEALGHTPQSYLALVLFYDGGQGLACRRRGALFVTSPGSRVVFVCPNGLQKWADTWPDWAEAAVIHEVLHTLGLGENPPSSDEINRAVLDACRP